MVGSAIQLVFPPVFSPFQAYSAVPSLAGVLKHAGHEVHAVDLNLIAYRAMLSPAYLVDALEAGRERDAFTASEAREIQRSVDEADANVRLLGGQEQCEGAREYLGALASVDRALEVVTGRFPSCSVRLGKLRMRYSAQSSQDIAVAVRDEQSNPFIPLFRQYLEEERQRIQAVSVLGLSLICLSQVIPGLTYATLFREVRPDVPIVIGGPALSRVASKLGGCKCLDRLFDFVILGEGETALPELLSQLAGKRDFGAVPNLLYREGGTLLRSRTSHVEDLDALSTPDYSVFPIGDYLSPETVLTVPVSRGCYWSKCTFCNQHVISRGVFRMRDAGLVSEDVIRLSSDHAARHFCFGAESLEPKHGERIADALLSRGIRVSWYGGSRMDRHLTYSRLARYRKSGCVSLMLGFESGSQRILNLMRKGVSLTHSQSILNWCGELGIAMHLFVLVGYPGERACDLASTSRQVGGLLGSGREDISYTVSAFQVLDGAPVSREPAEYDISVEEPQARGDLSYILPFTYRDGEQIDGKRAAIAVRRVLQHDGQSGFSALPVEYRIALCSGKATVGSSRSYGTIWKGM